MNICQVLFKIQNFTLKSLFLHLYFEKEKIVIVLYHAKERLKFGVNELSTITSSDWATVCYTFDGAFANNVAILLLIRYWTLCLSVIHFYCHGQFFPSDGHNACRLHVISQVASLYWMTLLLFSLFIKWDMIANDGRLWEVFLAKLEWGAFDPLNNITMCHTVISIFVFF